MNNNEQIKTLPPDKWPYLLKMAMAGAPSVPKQLFIRGELPSDDHIFLTVVGSRRYTDYGKAACETLIAGLRGLPVVIISGLAYGIDSIAHETALRNNIKTIAVPGSGLADAMIYPANHIGLAHRILSAGGCLLSPFEETTMGNNWTFPYRNRIMAGMAHATLIVEAVMGSGTLITAEHTVIFNRDLLVVPGSIFSKKSDGPHHYMRDGATPIMCVDDLLFALGLDGLTRAKNDYSDLPDDERRVMKLLSEPTRRDVLIEKLGMETSCVNSLVGALEIKGLIEEKLGELRRTSDI